MRKRLEKAKLEIESLFIVFDEVHFSVRPVKFVAISVLSGTKGLAGRKSCFVRDPKTCNDE